MKQIRLFPSGREVECQDSDTVLSALERAGYALPNNCRAGACGECKVKVRTGRFDQGMVLDMALSQEERQQGFGLMCMAKPLSDALEIEWGTEDARPKLFPPRENMLFVVTDKLERTSRITEFRLRPIGKPLRYWPGQYVQVGDERAGAPPRCYSLASAPRPDGEIALHVTKVANGATSAWLHDKVHLGDMIKLSGPYGVFIGDPSVETPVLCIAAGSGLAPILSLTDAALRRGYRHPVTLLFSGRSEADLYDRGLMAYWQARYRNFRFRATLTRERRDGLLHGRVQTVLPDLFQDLSGHSIFIAGSPEFVEGVTATVKAQGARPEFIHSEGYFQQYIPQAPSADRLVSMPV